VSSRPGWPPRRANQVAIRCDHTPLMIDSHSTWVSSSQSSSWAARRRCARLRIAAPPGTPGTSRREGGGPGHRGVVPGQSLPGRWPRDDAGGSDVEATCLRPVRAAC
jgi:hypothetical protein